MPFAAQASFLSMLLGSEVSAEASATGVIDFSQNSQTMALLQPSTASVALLVSKSAKETDQEIKEDESVNILSDNALMPTASPVDLTFVSDAMESSLDQISVYVVRKGDSLAQIAQMFDVSVDTILSANDMKKGDAIKEGDILLILPFSGVEHLVAKGDTLQGIANKYKVEVSDILFFNEMDLDAKIVVGDRIMIPGGSLISESSVVVKSGTSTKTGSSQGSSTVLGGYFINPVPSAKKSRGSSSSHKGVDLAAPVGTPIYASASGRVKFARTGYNGGFGNLVIISHPNGTETLYAHQSRIATSVGAQVKQGQVIGYVGNTGRSTGPHLHFEVHGAKNPGNDWSWKK